MSAGGASRHARPPPDQVPRLALLDVAPGPERMIGADPDSFWRRKRLAACLGTFREPAVIEASCGGCRAAIDLASCDADGGHAWSGRSSSFGTSGA